jgi:hypothetical protein
MKFELLERNGDFKVPYSDATIYEALLSPVKRGREQLSIPQLAALD